MVMMTPKGLSVNLVWSVIKWHFIRKNGVETLEKDKNGQALQGVAKSVTPAKDGDDVYTTINGTLQKYLENLMDTTSVKDAGAQNIVATLVKADTGEILATTQRPTFKSFATQ